MVVLEIAKLERNKLDRLPRELSKVTTLTHLSVHHNSLRALNDDIGSLTNLTYLDASHNLIDALPSTLPLLSSLKTLLLTNLPLPTLVRCPAPSRHR